MKQPKPRYLQPLPDNPYATGSKCIKIYIPDDVQWSSAFWGNFYALGKQWNWQRDVNHYASVVSVRWREIWQDARTRFDSGDCGVETIEYRMNDCGFIEFSIDGGETWETVADLRTCFILRSPYDDTNEIYPQGNYRALILRARSGNTVPLMTVYNTSGGTPIYIEPNGEGLNIGGTTITYYASGQLWVRFGSLVRWQSASHLFEGDYGQYIDFQAGTGTLYAEHVSSNYNFLVRAYNYLRLLGDNGGTEVRIGGNFITVPSLFGQSKADDTHTVALRRRASQTAYILRNEQSDGTLLSGIDDVGRYVLSSTTGGPSDDPLEGTTAFDASEPALWVKANDGWVKLTPNTPVAHQNLFNNFIERPVPDASVTFWMFCPADGYVMLPLLIEEGDRIQVSDVSGWWTDEHWQPTSSVFGNPDTDNFMGYHADGSLYNAPYGTNSGASDSSDPCVDFYHMALMYAYNRDFLGVEGTDYDYAESMDLTALKPWADFPRLWFFPNTSQFDGSSGGISFKVTFTAHSPSYWLTETYVDGSTTRHELGQDNYIGYDVDTAQTGGGYETYYVVEVSIWTDDTYTTKQAVSVADFGGFLTFADAGGSLTAWLDVFDAWHYELAPEGTPLKTFRFASTTAFSFYAAF